MEKNISRVISDDDIEQFRCRLLQYEMFTLKILYEYFWNDLTHIVEILDTRNFLSELGFRNIPMEMDYLLMEKELGSSAFSEILIRDIMDMGRDAVLALWESLFVLQNNCQNPNLIGVMAEFTERGDMLVAQINLDADGHQLYQLSDTHNIHKRHLLEMTQNLEDHSASGLAKQRRSGSISTCYLDLIVVSTQQFRNRTQHEIIETGGRHEHYLRKAQSTLERISPNRLFRWCHRSGCTPHAVMVSGVPGVGKTTLMQKFVYDWVTKKHYQRFSFIFFFKFRDLKRYDTISMEDMILDHYPYLQTQLQNILKDPEKLLFIFDGLDESVHDINFNSQTVCSNSKQQERVDDIVVSLVRQRLLNRSSILLTSRPTNLASVDIGVFQRVCEIMGFFPKEREAYFEHFFKDKELSNRVLQYVRQNDTLYTFCYIPSYCWIICTVLSMSFTTQMKDGQQNTLLPKTVTQLFVSYVAHILANHSADTEHPEELMISIGRMAQHGVMNHILSFDAKDFETFQVGITSKLLSSFIIESHTNTYSFLHLTIQEFFSALLHFLNFSEKDMELTLNRIKSFEDGRCEMFIRFLCGLSDGTTRSLLRSFLGSTTSASEYVIRWIKQEIETKWTLETDPSEKMNLLTYLFESRNKHLVRSTIGSHVQLDFSEFHLTPVDCTVLAFILESCKEIEYLNLDRCFIQSEGLERLTGILHTVQKLRLSNNDFKDSDMLSFYGILAPGACRVQKLSLRNNSFTLESCSSLATILIENQSLTDLDLSRNNLAGPYLADLITILSRPSCTISHLSLQQIKLKDEYAPLLISLDQNPNLTHLDLSHNYLTDVSAEIIQDLILKSVNLMEIRIEVNDLSIEGEEFLKQLEALKPGLRIHV
ncbi:NACHT, LRR and PYD domains-containing protein 3-like isoform X2 [Dendrobates tinctorius]|uniref:NACHT, LRR and PYD domains-containing protein 3-like isoform X2 n=1 Tax=Dendrobates tinctorius TaxID=92724 RepID=UPI003CCA24B9